MNPRESALENLMDEFTIEQNQPLDCISAPDIMTSSSSHSSSSSTHSMSASSHGALISLSLYTSSSLDMEQLRELIVRMRGIFKDYNSIHCSHTNGKNISSNGSRLGISTNLIPSSAEDVAACFKEVPDVYFRSDFSLQSPEIFVLTLGSRAQLLTGNWVQHGDSTEASVMKANHPDKDKSIKFNSNSKQQEQLSRYLDLVEVALLKHIWSRSPAFFRALDDIKGLQAQVQQASSCLRTLRVKLQALDEETAVGAMRIPQMYTRQKNESCLSDKILSIQRVLQARTDIQCFLDLEDYLGALEEIGYAKKLFSEELVGLSCVRIVGQQLDEYDELVCEIMCNRFVSLAVEWDDIGAYEDEKNGEPERRNDGFQLSESGLAPIGTESSPSGADSGSLEDLLVALLKCGRLSTALSMYKSRLSEAIKLIVRTCVQEYLSSSFDASLSSGPTVNDREAGSSAASGDLAQDDAPFAQRVKEMEDENFLSCLAMCFEHAILALTRSGKVDRFIEAALKRYPSDPKVSKSSLASGSSSNAAPATSASLLALSKSCLATACDLAQRSVAQLLSLRRDGTARISMEKMKFMWEISLHFVLTLEGLSGSTAYVIRQCLLTQTRAFLEHMHTTVKGRLANTLDSERWAQCDVGPERQLEIDRLSTGQAFLQQRSGSDADAEKRTSNGHVGNGMRKKDCAPVVVDGAPFKVVWSAMLLTEITLNYLNISVSFPPVTTDIIAKTVELLKLFDHRTKQLVLGAQAIQSAARLKSISAKHLAVTAQSIGLLLALLPHIRAALLAQLPPKHHMQLLELDRVSHLLIDHHGKIVAKFVGIVGDFVDQSASRLRLVDWDSINQGQGRQGASTSSYCEYFEEIQRNITALHRVLLESLPAEQVQDVFSRIFALLNRRIPMHFEETMPTTTAGKQRILDEIAHLVVAFSRLTQIDQVAIAATATLEDSFRRRYGVTSSNSSLVDCRDSPSDLSDEAGNAVLVAAELRT
jgi:vacuolar protein sorting-associated protein 54